MDDIGNDPVVAWSLGFPLNCLQRPIADSRIMSIVNGERRMENTIVKPAFLWERARINAEKGIFQAESCRS